MTMKGTVMGGAWLLIMPVLAVAASLDLQAANSQSLCTQIRELLQKNVLGDALLNPDAEPFSQIRRERQYWAALLPRLGIVRA